MVLLRMRQGDHVQRPLPERQLSPEGLGEQEAVGAAVDEHMVSIR